jgi:hypothetical protein
MHVGERAEELAGEPGVVELVRFARGDAIGERVAADQIPTSPGWANRAATRASRSNRGR